MLISKYRGQDFKLPHSSVVLHPIHQISQEIPQGSSNGVGKEIEPIATPSASRAVCLENLYQSAHHHRSEPCPEEQAARTGRGAVAAQVFEPYHTTRSGIHHDMCPFVHKRHIVERCMWRSAEARHPDYGYAEPRQGIKTQ